MRLTQRAGAGAPRPAPRSRILGVFTAAPGRLATGREPRVRATCRGFGPTCPGDAGPLGRALCPGRSRGRWSKSRARPLGSRRSHRRGSQARGGAPGGSPALCWVREVAAHRQPAPLLSGLAWLRWTPPAKAPLTPPERALPAAALHSPSQKEPRPPADRCRPLRHRRPRKSDYISHKAGGRGEGVGMRRRGLQPGGAMPPGQRRWWPCEGLLHFGGLVVCQARSQRRGGLTLQP